MSKIYCFDIDDTICETQCIYYANSQPIKERIIEINKLKKDGNTIIFYTARGFVSKIDYL